MAYVADAQQILAKEKKERVQDFARSILQKVEETKRSISRTRKDCETRVAQYLKSLKTFESILALSDANLEEASYLYYEECKGLPNILEILTPPEEEE